jgi:hypothetical protein
MGRAKTPQKRRESYARDRLERGEYPHADRKNRRRAKRPSRFLLCVRNRGSEDLEVRKIYQVVPDASAAREGLVRVVDESGEDYLYPAEYFVSVRLPAGVAEELRIAV